MLSSILKISPHMRCFYTATVSFPNASAPTTIEFRFQFDGRAGSISSTLSSTAPKSGSVADVAGIKACVMNHLVFFVTSDVKAVYLLDLELRRPNLAKM